LPTWDYGEANTTRKHGEAGKFQEKNGAQATDGSIPATKRFRLTTEKFGLL
jgi:hypothetical protein